MTASSSLSRRVFLSLGSARWITTSSHLSGRGMRHTVRGLKLQEEELDQLRPDDLEAMTDVSLDAFNQEVNNIEKDEKRYQKHLRWKTIEHKYFKSYAPREDNLLTWSMKEQLKYLYSNDPEQWTPEVLSKSFPISPIGVEKLIKSHWLPKSEKERERHDRAVVTRWRKHLRGQTGSLRILEKTLNNKFLPKNLPSPVMSMKDVVDTLEGLRFDGEEPQDVKKVKKKKKHAKQVKKRGKPFSAIIEDYELKHSNTEKQAEESASVNEFPRISAASEYIGSYSTVSVGSKIRKSSYRKKDKLMTFTEFMKKNKKDTSYS